MNIKLLRSWVQNLATIAIKMLSIYFNSLSMPTLENKNITIHQLPFSKHRTPSLPCFPASNLQSFHRAGTKRVELLHRPTIAGTGTSIGAICGICAAVTEGIAAFAALKGVQPLKGIPRRRCARAVHLRPPGKGWWKLPGMIEGLYKSLIKNDLLMGHTYIQFSQNRLRISRVQLWTSETSRSLSWPSPGRLWCHLAGFIHGLI